MIKIQLRHFSSGQLQTALRPFFFLCHPDLFGKFPEQRAINENSLQVLSAHLEALQRRSVPHASPMSLPFYLRTKGKEPPYKLVSVALKERDTKTFVTKILQTCDLETTYIEKISSESFSPKHTGYQHKSGYKYTVNDDESQFSEDFDIFNIKVRRARENETLEKFIGKNLDLAQIRTKALDDLREEVEKLKIHIEKKLELKEVIYNCGWNYEHFRGCLKSLENLFDLYGDDMQHIRNKNVIFSQFTGVSLEGDIHLFTGDVQNNWLDVSAVR
jgi:Domain of unknown function (DUF4461)/Domain of unknown function (DUF4460)